MALFYTVDLDKSLELQNPRILWKNDQKWRFRGFFHFFQKKGHDDSLRQNLSKNVHINRLVQFAEHYRSEEYIISSVFHVFITNLQPNKTHEAEINQALSITSMVNFGK